MAGESDYPLFEEPKRIEVLLKQHGNYSLGYDETVVSTGSVVSLATGEIKDPGSRTRTGILNIYQDAVEMGQMQVIDHGGHDYITFKTEHGADFGTMPMTPMAVHARIQHQVKGGLMSLEDAGLFFSGMCCYLTAKANAAAHTSAYRAELIKLGMEPRSTRQMMLWMRMLIAKWRKPACALKCFLTTLVRMNICMVRPPNRPLMLI